MMRLFSLAVVLVFLGCDAEPEGDFAPNVVAPPEPVDDSEGRTSALGQAIQLLWVAGIASFITAVLLERASSVFGIG